MKTGHREETGFDESDDTGNPPPRSPVSTPSPKRRFRAGGSRHGGPDPMATGRTGPGFRPLSPALPPSIIRFPELSRQRREPTVKIEETFLVGAPIGRVWAFVMNPAEVAPCVPGCGEVEILGGGEYRASVMVAMGPVRTSFNVSVELVETEAPTYAATRTRGEEGGKASMLSADSELHLRAVGPDETEVRYLSEVSVVGRFGRFGFGMMKKKARDLGERFADSMRGRLETAEQGTRRP